MYEKIIFILSNINIHFKPMLIYKTHILKSIKKKGFIVTITQVFQLIYPTVMIFYYNFLIKKSNKGGLYDFIKQGEQADLLRNSKFKININDKLTYAGSAFLSKGTK